MGEGKEREVFLLEEERRKIGLSEGEEGCLERIERRGTGVKGYKVGFWNVA